VEQAQALIKAAAGVLRANGMRLRRGPYRLHGYGAAADHWDPA
jgi:hypothetical protein